ncbi:photosystem II 10 kDa polypeptide, chloroplastic-like [Phragmites australis]|uniref:photosystem II 10 kDa polypeptide, chloroplastic-like n=1 Tax=Phragmites australis TaxID=29695 RepID=UPI002D77DA6D|nr:photosystem II 10 kDa polypeptide, chloroplastic-like [Phragmites australis]
MAASVMTSLALKSSPSPFLERPRFRGIQVQSSARSSSLRVMAKKAKKIQTSQPFGPAGGLNFKDGVDASGRPAKGKGVYQFVSKYGANVDGHSPIYNPEEWSPSGDVYVGGKTGLLLWAVTLSGVLLAGALLVYNTSALAS